MISSLLSGAQHQRSQHPTRIPARRATALLTGGLAVILAMAGCGAGQSTTNADGKTVLTIQAWKGGGTQPANMDAINAAFEKANPNIDVQFEFVPPNKAYLQKVQPEFLAGKAPDIVMTDVTKIPEWSRAGYLMDLSKEGWVDKIDSSALPSTTVGDKVYAQPMESIAEGLFVNMDLLSKAGIQELPTTWPEFTKDLAALKANGITAISLPNKAGDTGQMALNGIASTLVYQANPEWDSKFMEGEASFADWKPALEQLMSLQDQGYVDYKAALGVDEWSEGLNDFAAGKNAFWFQGAWEIDAVQKAGLKNFKFMPWPAGASGTKPSVGIISGTSWSINAKTKVTDAAKKYLDFWADPANAKPYLEIEHAISPWKNATNPDDAVSAPITEAYEDGRFHFLARNSWLTEEGNTKIKSKIQGLMLGQYQDSDEFLKELDSSLRPSK